MPVDGEGRGCLKLCYHSLLSIMSVGGWNLWCIVQFYIIKWFVTREIRILWGNTARDNYIEIHQFHISGIMLLYNNNMSPHYV